MRSFALRVPDVESDRERTGLRRCTRFSQRSSCGVASAATGRRLHVVDAQDLNLPITVHDLRLLLRSHGVVSASIFGSYARGEATADSDLDLLVDYASHATLFDHLALRAELEDRTRGPVDVVSDRTLSKYHRPYVERDRVEILDRRLCEYKRSVGTFAT